MALKTRITPDYALKRIREIATGARGHLLGQRASFVRPTTSALEVLNLASHFGQAVALLGQYAAVEGIIPYARMLYQTTDPNYDVVAEYVATRDAMIAARDGLISMFPKQAGTSFLLYETFNPDGSRTVRTFTAEQLVPVVALIDNVVATIEAPA